MNRRDFLKLAASGIGGLITGCGKKPVYKSDDLDIIISLNGRDFKYSVPKSDYDCYQSMDHQRTSKVEAVDKRHAQFKGWDLYRNWLTPDDWHIRNIADFLARGCKTDEQRAQRVMNFVHNVGYNNDPKGDYIRFPLETIIDQSGDCEDSALLAASLMKAQGLAVALVCFPSHVGFAIKGNFQGTHYKIDGQNFFYAECTSDGNSRPEIGWISQKEKNKPAYVLEV